MLQSTGTAPIVYRKSYNILINGPQVTVEGMKVNANLNETWEPLMVPFEPEDEQTWYVLQNVKNPRNQKSYPFGRQQHIMCNLYSSQLDQRITQTRRKWRKVK